MQTSDTSSSRFTSGDPHADLLRYRSDFPIVMNKTFLNTCSLGALGTRTIANVHEYLSLWAEMGASAWYKKWLGKGAELRGAQGGVRGVGGGNREQGALDVGVGQRRWGERLRNEVDHVSRIVVRQHRLRPCQGRDCLALLRSERIDEDEGFYLRVSCRCIADDGTTVGMANQNDGSADCASVLLQIRGVS